QTTCVRTGKLRVSSVWYEDTDLDLYVEVPGGETLFWEARNVEGGIYDFHNCTGKCENPGPYVENVFFENDVQEGTYKVWVVHEQARAATSFEFEVEYEGERLNFAGDVGNERGAESAVFEFTVDGD
ncbi:unnamed protein product, partial [Laminaria digitata]